MTQSITGNSLKTTENPRFLSIASFEKTRFKQKTLIELYKTGYSIRFHYNWPIRAFVFSFINQFRYLLYMIDSVSSSIEVHLSYQLSKYYNTAITAGAIFISDKNYTNYPTNQIDYTEIELLYKSRVAHY